MKVLIIKRTTIVLALGFVLFASAFMLNLGGVEVGAVYLYATNRRIPIYSVQTEDNKMSISFDAAWGADKTSQIMSICDEYGVKATFFLVGFWVEKYPEKVKEIYDRGFEIGLHSNTHPDMTKLSKKQIKNELETNIQLIQNITGVKPKLFRPPFGAYNNALIEVCDELNLSCIQWNVDSLDWKGLSASDLAGRVTSKAKAGSIVLFHNNSDNITSGLRLVLEHFKNTTQIVPVGQLIYYENFTINNQGTQIKN